MDKLQTVVKIPATDDASDKILIGRLADIVNTSYKIAESDIFIPSYKRTSESEIAQFISNGQLAVAYLVSTNEPIGCVFVKLLSPTLGDFGMLALDTKYQGTGLGRQLAAFAEDECRKQGCTTMQLEILVPSTFHHEGKARLLGWYLCLISATALASSAGDTQTPISLQSPSTQQPSPLLELHKSLVEQASITGSEKPVTDFLTTYLEDAGLTVETQAVAKNRDNILAYYGDKRKTRVLVTSHLDTVPPYWPYEQRGDEIWGRGTVDAKGSIATQVIAVLELQKKRAIDTGDVALLFVVGEETGGDGMKAANDLGLSWESVIFGEPTELKLARGHKGGLRFTIKAKGKAGHSGYPETGSNAIDSLVRGLSALQQAELPWSEEFGNTTINVGTIEGGVAPNVIPAGASAVGSVRIAAGTANEMNQLIAQIVEGSDAHLVVEPSTYSVDPISLDHDVAGFETVVVNYGTDIPSLKGSHKKYLYGPGSIMEAHSNHEHLRVSDLEDAIEGYKRLISHALRRSAQD
ncbi:hypothetical protein HYE67_001775 [Fusarium culmorum]|uniref:N-acetyltransferase domain-containing protein n=1 Tax=Fusarium culmorum TaxID=5516 RepID=A0A7S8HT74_FUSCU|nr:hypothetical protein HYE67_001775 [Fusarium culmorum]